MMRHLRYDYQRASMERVEKHAQKVMYELGITWTDSTSQSIAEQFWFWNCENIPDPLPSYITTLDIDPMECVGYGLSLEEAKEIINYKPEKTMNDREDKVREFHTAFEHPVKERPEIPSPHRGLLRIELIQEELKELKEAWDNNDLVETLDALCDLQYVLSGTILECGMGEIFDKAFEEVQHSNMSKICEDEDAANRTIQSYSERFPDRTFIKIKVKGDRYIVQRDDGKALKSVDYHPVNLARFIEIDSDE